MRVTGPLGAIVLGTALVFAGGAMADDVRVLATGVFATSLRDLHAPFAAASGSGFVATVANAGGVKEKVLAGVPADVVLTSSAGIDALARAGKLDGASKVEIGRMRLGLGVPVGAPVPATATPDQVRAVFLASRAIAYVDPRGGATAGAFAETAFDRLGVAAAVHAKAVLCNDGAEVVAALSSGRATVGVTQASEISGATGAVFAGVLPDALNTESTYAGATMSAVPTHAAVEFLAFLRGPAATARLRQAGWSVP